ncbi:D-galactarate dehydratase [Pseudothioclava arenosa]|uniref:D-galactarate dehydratase n=1 Tax=Pseudothioclava arenosa TaxID=1795308 RepID=A0A2A4CRV3_9RHOB|nr:D-galactarate dehydratase [Pseudothioclava arenosa]PCD77207.1 D-galactarate dehydratase [Pseudothioclava arenosa]
MRIIWQAGLGLGLIALAGCAELGLVAKPEAVAPAVATPAPAEGANTAEALDTTTEAERAAALAEPEPAAETELGRTIASLGDPTDPGFWIKTPLVSAPAKGRAEAANGRSVLVDLIPLDGGAGGSQISLPALRLLELPLTDLPELTLYRL